MFRALYKLHHNFMLGWTAIRIIRIITNSMHCLSSVYWVITPLHVSGVSAVHHQEVECIYVANGTCYTSELIIFINCKWVDTRWVETSLVVSWSEFLTTDHDVPSLNPGSTMGIFPWRGTFPWWPWSGWFSRPLLVLHNNISPSTSSGQRNCASWASQPQKSVTLRPQPGGESTKSIRDMWWHWQKNLSWLSAVLARPAESTTV
jgi:hypothetical protein